MATPHATLKQQRQVMDANLPFATQPPNRSTVAVVLGGMTSYFRHEMPLGKGRHKDGIVQQGLYRLLRYLALVGGLPSLVDYS